MLKNTKVKIIHTTTLLLIACISLAQDIPMKDGKVVYEVIDSSQLRRIEIHQRAGMWFANTFRSSKDVIQYSDTSEMIGKGYLVASVTHWGMGFSMDTKVTIKVSCRDGKYRIQVYDIAYRPAGQDFVMTFEELLRKPKSNKKLIDGMDKACRDAIASAREAINKQTDF